MASTLHSHTLQTTILGAVLVACGGTGSPAKDTPAAAATEAPSAAPPAAEQPAPPASDEAAAASSAPPAAPSAAPPQAPPSTVEISEPSTTGKLKNDPSVGQMIQATKDGLRGCYERGLKENPTAAGVVEFRIQVTASGQIKKVESANPSNMPGSVTNCMIGRLGALSFPAAGVSTVTVKVTCKPGG